MRQIGEWPFTVKVHQLVGLLQGKERGTSEPFDMSSLVSEMLDLLEVSDLNAASGPNEACPPCAEIQAPIRQVVMNLVTDAHRRQLESAMNGVRVPPNTSR